MAFAHCLKRVHPRRMKSVGIENVGRSCMTGASFNVSPIVWFSEGRPSPDAEVEVCDSEVDVFGPKEAR